MNVEKLDLVIQYALACARENEDWKDRSLCTTELIKYVYLADLAHAERQGETFTGVPWRFHHFGPWAAEVADRLVPATRAVNGETQEFETDTGRGCRFKIVDGGLKEHLERKLPPHVATAIRKHVRSFGSQARNDLLHLVYGTPPMTSAAPGEFLVFGKRPPRPAVPDEQTVSARKLKKLKAALETARARRAARTKRKMVRVDPPPVDEQFAAFLEEISGGAVPEFELSSHGVATLEGSVARVRQLDGVVPDGNARRRL